MSHVINGFGHPVIDESDDGIFVIDPISRIITLEVDGSPAYFGGPVLVKGDHNSERLTFKIPKVIEGHDMTTCNLVRIHYIAVDSATSTQYKDAYDVPSSDRAAGENEYLVFNWLVDGNVTRSAGQVSFVVQFACTKEEERTVIEVDAATGESVTVNKTVSITEYSWSTLPYTELSVSDGITNTKQEAVEFENEYNSIVTGWHNELSAAITQAQIDLANAIAESNNSNIKNITTDTSSEDGGINTVTIEFNDPNKEPTVFEVQNGSQGSDGLSAYQVALNNGFEGSEEEWVESLKAIGYEDCLKGVTITKAEYESLSDAEKNREDFVYIIKDAQIEADYATVAEGFTEDGDIAAALNQKVHNFVYEVTNESDTVYNLITHLVNNGYTNKDVIWLTLTGIVISGVYIGYFDTWAGNTVCTFEFSKAESPIQYSSGDSGGVNTKNQKIIDVFGNKYKREPIEELQKRIEIIEDPSITGYNTVEISYTLLRGVTDGVVIVKTQKPATIYAPDNKIFTSATITKIYNDYVTGVIDISDDKKSITISLNKSASGYEDGELTTEITYSYKLDVEKTPLADQADTLSLINSNTYTFSSASDTPVNVTPGRAYLVYARRYTNGDGETAILYVDQQYSPLVRIQSRSTVLSSNGHAIFVYQSDEDDKWYGYVSNEKNGTRMVYASATFIEL